MRHDSHDYTNKIGNQYISCNFYIYICIFRFIVEYFRETIYEFFNLFMFSFCFQYIKISVDTLYD